MTKKEANLYYAGLFDGEGCVMIAKRKIPDTGRPSYQVRAAIAMVDIAPLERLKHIYGIGSLYSAGRTKLAVMKAWQWVVASRVACEFFKQILPYSITKREEMLLAIHFQDYITKNRYTHRKVFTNQPESVSQYKEECYLKMKALKTRFPHHP